MSRYVGRGRSWCLRASLAVAVCFILVGCEPQPQQAAPEQPQQAAPEVSLAKEADTILGSWQSVDFVRQVEAFKPGQQSSQGDLFLKDFQAFANGTTSLGWTWSGGQVTHRDGRTVAQCFVRTVGSDTYLFLPWLSGDVTERGMAPKYYVLKKVPG